MSNKSISGASSVAKQLWQQGEVTKDDDLVAVETPIALMYNCLSYAVMMATPQDLEDFALGFSLTEGIIESADEMLDIEIADAKVESEKGSKGKVISMIIPAHQLEKIKGKQRNITGRTGCGLCGAETLEQAIQAPNIVPNQQTFSHQAVQNALMSFAELQQIKNMTGAVHAAVWCDTSGDALFMREDVGRHNALDKLLGALAQDNQGKTQQVKKGFVLITSRASYEMVTKTASAGIELLVAVSAPTTMAIDMAKESGLTLVGFGRQGRHSTYANSHRLEN